MSKEQDWQRSKRDRIGRLRDRLRRAKAINSVGELADVVQSILDLLADEL